MTVHYTQYSYFESLCASDRLLGEMESWREESWNLCAVSKWNLPGEGQLENMQTSLIVKGRHKIPVEEGNKHGLHCIIENMESLEIKKKFIL